MTRPIFGLALVLLSACSTDIAFDPAGYRCDPGGVCPTGYTCVADLCQLASAERCATVTCTQAAQCVGTTKVKTFAGTCTKATGACTFVGTETACTNGCSNGACINACSGVTCTTPPAASCDGSTRRGYQPTGTCNTTNGLCDYTPVETLCVNGCVNGTCINQDLCVGIACTTPPAPGCDGPIARTYAAQGVCTAGTCGYQVTEVTCPDTCLNGVCIGTAATFAQTGPRVRFAINALDVAPNSNGNVVVAVGNNGAVARWNGSQWASITTPTTQDLHAVHFVTSSAAWLVGANRTVWTYRNGVVTAVGTPPGSSKTNFVSVFGKGDANVLLADDVGAWFKWSGTSWAQGSLPSGDGPYTMTSAFIDETNRERIGGRCGTGSNQTCIAYREPTSGLDWSIDNDSDSSGCAVLGPWVDAPLIGFGPDVLCGKPSNALRRHAYYGFPLIPAAVPSLDEGNGLVGLSRGFERIGGIDVRLVYALTASNGVSGVGALYRMVRAVTVQTTQLLTTHFGEEHLSQNDAAGVLVADVLRSQNANTIIRRSASVNEALDLAEDWAAITTAASGDLALISTSGDIATRPTTSAIYTFVRGPAEVSAVAATGERGTGVLIVGSNLVTGAGLVERYAPGVGVTQIATNAPSTTFTSVCRASDTEAYAVGTGGAIYLINSIALTAAKMSSGTTNDLLSVDCGSTSIPVACGKEGTVLRLTNGTWAPMLPTVPSTARLSSCEASGETVWVSGEGVFARIEASSPAWSVLPVKSGLRGLLVRSPTDIYGFTLGVGTSEIQRFDGSVWRSALQVPGMLRGGAFSGSKLTFAGTGGLLVEGQ